MLSKFRGLIAFSEIAFLGILAYIFIIFALSDNFNDEVFFRNNSFKPIAEPKINEKNIQSNSTAEILDEDLIKDLQIENLANGGASADFSDIFPKHFIVVASTLNVRIEPRKNAPIINRLKNGEVISVINIQNEWGEIEGGGWVAMEFLN